MDATLCANAADNLKIREIRICVIYLCLLHQNKKKHAWLLINPDDGSLRDAADICRLVSMQTWEHTLSLERLPEIQMILEKYGERIVCKKQGIPPTP